jgi:putative membrane protein
MHGVVEPDIWKFQAHPEVWLLMLGIIGLGIYAARVVGPKVVRDGAPVTRSQKRWFIAAVAVLWIAADYPVHDIAERYLYSVHMLQHLLITFVAAPMFLLATPTWLAELVLGDGKVRSTITKLCRPVVAGVAFNAAFVFTHWPSAVNTSVTSAPIHYALHLLIFSSALLMWMPVCGPLPELRLSLPAQMIYLFCQSIVPTIPSAFLLFADSPLYSAYVHPFTVAGMDAVADQQTAGVLMKLGAGVFLWFLIAMLFARWARRNMEAERAGIVVTERDLLTWATVEAELARLESVGPAPIED